MGGASRREPCLTQPKQSVATAAAVGRGGVGVRWGWGGAPAVAGGLAQVVAQVGFGARKSFGAQLFGCTTRVWRKWWRKWGLAQVVAQVWRKLGLAQVWRKLVWWRRFGASSGSYLKGTCAKLAPNQLAPNLRHQNPLAPNPTCAKLAPNPTCATTCAKPGRCIHNVALHPKSCAPKLFRATTCAKPHLRHHLCHHRPAAHMSRQKAWRALGAVGAGWGGVGWGGVGWGEKGQRSPTPDPPLSAGAAFSGREPFLGLEPNDLEPYFCYGGVFYLCWSGSKRTLGNEKGRI